MANSLVVRKGTSLEKRSPDLRAAQYVRMSTEFQRYSIENQAVVIAAYAQAHNLTIVRTYRDEGESGLKLANRAGLRELLGDVQSDRADFGHILVYDISRWGRFQDVDESAHYEFVCRSAGLKVVYCAEQFDNDGTMLSSILKNIKRVMAAEYSRELSDKVFAGQSRIAQLGFWVGGQPGFALRRELVDAAGNPRGLLKRGQRKAIVTDRVILRAGPDDEVATLRWIFKSFVTDRKNETSIARELNARGVSTHRQTRWDLQLIGRILRNEVYVGNTIYNRTSNRLRKQRTVNTKAAWVRGEHALEQIIPQPVFDQAQHILQRRVQKLPSDEMLKRLRVLALKHGCLSSGIIDRARATPDSHAYVSRFGSLRKAYALIGYTPRTDCSYLEARAARDALIGRLAEKINAGLSTATSAFVAERAGGHLELKDGLFLSFRVSRCWQQPQKKCPVWTLRRGAKPRPGLFVIVRMDERNQQPLDFILTPLNRLPKRPCIVSERAFRQRFKNRFENSAGLIDALKKSLRVCQ